MVVVGDLEGLEQRFRLFTAFQKLPEWILASATPLLGTSALAVLLLVGGSRDGEGLLLGRRRHSVHDRKMKGRERGRDDGRRVAGERGAYVAAEAEGECDAESGGGGDEDGVGDDGVVDEPATERVVGHNHRTSWKSSPKILSISDDDTLITACRRWQQGQVDL